MAARAISGSRNEQKAFVRKVALARNYEVHLDPDNEKDAASGIEVFVLAFQLRMLVEAMLLLDLGFTDEEIDGMFDRIRRYEQLSNFRLAVEEERAADAANATASV